MLAVLISGLKARTTVSRDLLFTNLAFSVVMIKCYHKSKVASVERLVTLMRRMEVINARVEVIIKAKRGKAQC